MKKGLAIVLALSMLLLSGCGGSKKTVDAGDVTTVTVWSNDGGGKALWGELVDEFNQTTGKEKGIQIEWVALTDTSQNDVAQQNGTLPEICNCLTNAQFEKFAKNGDLLALEDIEGGMKFYKEYGQQDIEKTTTIDGKHYCVMTNVTVPGLIYNKDLFKAAGIVDENGEAKAPETFAELREDAKKITDAKKGVYGFSFPLKFSIYYTLEVQTEHSYMPGEAVDLDALTVDYSKFKDRYQWILDLKSDGSIFPGAETLDNDTSRAYFAEGKVGMMPGMSWDVGVLNTQFPAKCDWDVAPFPVLDGHEFTSYSQSLGGNFILSSNAAKKPADKVMEVYKFLHSLEVRTRRFEEGIVLSYKTDVLDVADRNKVDPRFLKFGEFVDEDKAYVSSERYNIEGDNLNTLFQKVWIGEITLDEALSDYSKRTTEGLRKAVDEGTYDVKKQKENYKILRNSIKRKK